MRANPIRFTGMASGMDTDSIVKDLMRPQQYKIDNEKKQQALLKLKQDAWKDMNKKLFDFHTKFTDKMRVEGTFKQNITTSSNPDAIKIKSDKVVPQGTHIFDVTQLAESASAVGRGADGKGIPKDATVASLMGEGATLPLPTELTFKVAGKTDEPLDLKISLKSTDKISDVIKKIDGELKGTGTNKTDTGFTASFDETNGSFFVSSKETGWKQLIQFDDDQDGALVKKLGLKAGKEIRGKVAKYSYNGAKFTSPTNKIEVNGIEATLTAAGAGPITISSEPDAGAIYTWVKDFITEYNNLLDEINEKIGTKPGKDIMPLTAEERESMSESEIKLWEDKLNSSLFYQDKQLTDFANSARRILGNVLGVSGEGEYNSLASLGIVTGSWEEKGKLHIQGDEDDTLHSDKPNRLKEAIEKNPEGVTRLFTTLGKNLYEAHNTTLVSSNKLKSAMNFYNDKVMTDKVKTFDKQIATLEERMYRMEEMHYAKFAAMEKMLSSLNNQSSWLAQQFGGM